MNEWAIQDALKSNWVQTKATAGSLVVDTELENIYIWKHWKPIEKPLKTFQKKNLKSNWVQTKATAGSLAVDTEFEKRMHVSWWHGYG